MNYLPEKDLFRPDEAAKYLGFTRKTVYEWIKKGKLKAVRVKHNRIRIRREAILEIITDYDNGS